MLDREMEYQAKLKQQKQELEKLLIEKQKLMDAQRQLSEIARSTLAADEKLAESEVKVFSPFFLTLFFFNLPSLCSDADITVVIF